LSRQFGKFTACDKLSFQVKKGEIFGFLGANGAGKTTAIRMLCGLLKPSSGEASIAGRDIYREREKIKKHIGYMSQRFSLYEDLNIWENIYFFGGIYGLKNTTIKERGKELIELLNMNEYANKLISDIPLGWKQKLAFSVALLHRPDIVFLDEPTSGVDPITRRQFWEMIYRTADDGITVFITTHYLDEAEYCDRISIMVDGQIKALDTPGELKNAFSCDSINDVFLKLTRG